MACKFICSNTVAFAIDLRRLILPVYLATATEYIRESILNPSIYLVEGYEQSRHHMPAFTHLSEADVEALVQMLLQQK
jgi:hypothetical protein